MKYASIPELKTGSETIRSGWIFSITFLELSYIHIYSNSNTSVTDNDERNAMGRTFAIPGPRHWCKQSVVDIPTLGHRRMAERLFRQPQPQQSVNHARAIQGMESDSLVEPVYATIKTWKGRDVHLNVWTCQEFKRESQDSVCLAAF